MYKFIGIGLLAFLALIIIPVSSATQSDDPSMYGMATIALKDKSGNILFENQVHNEVVDQGTAFMLNATFRGGTWPGNWVAEETGIISKARNAKRPMPINLYIDLIQKPRINNYLKNWELIEYYKK